MIVVAEHYLTKCLDSGVYQTLIKVDINGTEFVYKNQIRLWSEEFLEELREKDKQFGRNFVMNCIRRKLFQEG